MDTWEVDYCKYCNESIRDIVAEGINCKECSSWVHLNCLKRGSVPGGFTGDLYFTFTCLECSQSGQEIFQRDRLPWFQAIVLVLYHISLTKPGLARNGYFHWKMHLVNIIDKHWDVLFNRDFKRKKKWIGTISGNLSHYSPCFFHSGTSIFGEQGWWTLTFPKLTPNVITKLNAELMARRVKLKETSTVINDFELFKEILDEKGFPSEYLKSVFDDCEVKKSSSLEVEDLPIEVIDIKKELLPCKVESAPKKFLLPTVDTISESPPRKIFKTNSGFQKSASDSCTPNDSNKNENNSNCQNAPVKFLNPMAHYNTSLSSIHKIQGMQFSMKLMGGLREETILSPYSSLYLKPYIRRDVEATPAWLKLMAEILVKSNKSIEYILPPRASIDYAYVQPSHIPAVNSLCNQFFWPGIDLTDVLQYPDFSCVVLYRKLVIGFAFIIPDVKFHENYISFIFVRPGWRNCGIARFMIYHLIQTSVGKDVTLHVSVNNPAMFLYQKFGFKVEHVEQNFYDKYYQSNAKESKHAFFCRLER